MIRTALLLLAASAPAGAQVGPITFDAGKRLPIPPGQWTYMVTQTGSEARYGGHLLLRCERATRSVVIARPGAPAGALTIVTDLLTKALPPSGRVTAGDPILDAIAFSRGRFLVAGGLSPVLAVPSWPEPARAIEDCRN